MSDRSAFVEVVTIEHVSTSSRCGFFHRSQIPANVKIESSVRVKQKGGFPLLNFRPLVKSVGRNQAAARQQGFAEGRLLGNRLGNRVNHFVACLSVLRPERDQPPTYQ